MTNPDRHFHAPDPNHGSGAMFYALAAALTVAALLSLIHHIRVTWR
jgi:hypothetical protein